MRKMNYFEAMSDAGTRFVAELSPFAAACLLGDYTFRYNGFNGGKLRVVTEAIGAFHPDARLFFGREHSPVIYVVLPADNNFDPQFLAAMERTKPDEFDTYPSEHLEGQEAWCALPVGTGGVEGNVLRLWWD